jgi:imidazolonepropionase-like amidohydrolase
MGTYIGPVLLFDGHTVRRRAGVLVRDGLIQWVGPHARAPREARAAEEIDPQGGTLTPGLIDAHVHLFSDAGPDFVAESRVTDAYGAIKAAGNAARHLAAGVTTVRDLGGPGAVASDVARAIADGRIPGPRVIASGTALTISGGHGWNSFARQVDGPDEVRRGVREQLRSGARSIKIVATGGVLTPGITFDFTAFTEAEVDAAVDEAHSWGVPIAAHAIGREGILRCVRAGVDSIEHGAMIDTVAAREMVARGTFHVATINALRAIVDHPDEVPAHAVEKASAVIELAHDAFRRSVRAGVRLAVGTDGGTPFNHHGSAPIEAVRMVEWGCTPLRALQAATSGGAELLRVPEVGTVEVGKVADLVLYATDPLEDISALLAPAMVLQAGQIGPVG